MLRGRIQFAGLICIYANADSSKRGDWVEITAKFRIKYEEAYDEKAPFSTRRA